EREKLIAALDHVVSRLIERERLNAPQPGPLHLVGIEVDLAVDPRIRLADAVQKCRVHLESGVEVLEVARDGPSARVVAVARLAAKTRNRSIVTRAVRNRFEREELQRLVRSRLQREIGAGDAIERPGLFGVGDDGADIAPRLQAVLHTADVERPVSTEA